MKTRNRVLVLAAAVLLAYSYEAFGNNTRMFSRLKQRLAANMPHSIKQVFLRAKDKQSLVQQLIMGASIAAMVCTLPSCGKLGLTSQGTETLRGVAPQPQDYVRTAEEVIGRHVHFIVEGKHQVGYVADAISATQVKIDPYSGNLIDIETKQIQGIEISGHADQGKQIIISNDEEGLPKILHAFILAVYDSNYYEVMVGGYIDESFNRLVITEKRFVTIIPYDKIIAVSGQPNFLENYLIEDFTN